MTSSEPKSRFELRGLDGANPLGFLAALGTLVALEATGEPGVRLAWRRLGSWVPTIEGVSFPGPDQLSDAVAGALRGAPVSPEAERRREETQKACEAAKRALARKQKELKARGRISREERARWNQMEVAPLRAEYDERRLEWLQALPDAVPRPELALGKRLDCTDSEFRERTSALLVGAGMASREALDLLAAFGSDACLQKGGSLEPTPFQFISGSGHQFFLETVTQLMANVSPERVRAALFEPWTYPDEKLSMRWDPQEDRRYALMDRDPTASDNKSRTVWMANLLAYRALALFPSAPTRRGLSVAGWSEDGAAFTWPIWESAAPLATIRSLLQLRELTREAVDSSTLRARGVSAAYRARRIRVPPSGANFKVNFTPARAVA
jgi:hypothetical protein